MHREKDNFRKGYLVLNSETQGFRATPILLTPSFLWENFEPQFLRKFRKLNPSCFY